MCIRMYVRRNKSGRPQIPLCIMYPVPCSNQARLNKGTGSADEEELGRGVQVRVSRFATDVSASARCEKNSVWRLGGDVSAAVRRVSAHLQRDVDSSLTLACCANTGDRRNVLDSERSVILIELLLEWNLTGLLVTWFVTLCWSVQACYGRIIWIFFITKWYLVLLWRYCVISH